MHKTVIVLTFLTFILSNCSDPKKEETSYATLEDYLVINSTFYHLLKNNQDTIGRQFGYSNYVKNFEEIPSRFIRNTFIVNKLVIDTNLNENLISKLSQGSIKISAEELKNLETVNLKIKYIKNIGIRRIYGVKEFGENDGNISLSEEVEFSRIIYNNKKDKALFTVRYNLTAIEGFTKAVYVVKRNGIWIIKSEKLIISWIH